MIVLVFIGVIFGGYDDLGISFIISLKVWRFSYKYHYLFSYKYDTIVIFIFFIVTSYSANISY